MTCERRGAPGSPPDEPAAEVKLETHSEDARHLRASLTSEPVRVFGSSAGALIGLDLAVRHPGLLHPLVVHEPPVEGGDC